MCKSSYPRWHRYYLGCTNDAGCILGCTMAKAMDIQHASYDSRKQKGSYHLLYVIIDLQQICGVGKTRSKDMSQSSLAGTTVSKEEKQKLTLPQQLRCKIASVAQHLKISVLIRVVDPEPFAHHAPACLKSSLWRERSAQRPSFLSSYNTTYLQASHVGDIILIRLLAFSGILSALRFF